MVSLSESVRRLPRWLSRSRHQIRQANRARDGRDYARAAELYARALRRHPDNGPIHVQAGHMFKESGALADAERHYLQALALMPNDADVHLHLAHFYKNSDRPLDAFAAFQRVADLDPHAPRAELELARRKVGLNESGFGERAAAPKPLTAQQLDASGLLDRAWYSRKYPDIGAADPLSHFYGDGRFELRQPGPGFDPTWYLQAYPEVVASGLDPVAHYLAIGEQRGYKPVGPPVYQRWIDQYDTLAAHDLRAIDAHIADKALAAPSVLVAVDAASAPFVGRAVRALRRQRLKPRAVYLCLTPDCPADVRRGIRALTGSDDQFHIVGGDDDEVAIDGAVVLIDAAVELRDHALYMFVQAATDDTALVYADHDRIDAAGVRRDPVFKPQASPELIRQVDYIGACAMLPDAADAADAAAALTSGRDTVAGLIRATALAAPREAVVQVPFVLYHDHAERAAPPSPRGIRLADADLPTVSIIIPTRDRLDLLRPCIESLRRETDYPRDRIDIIVVDNASVEDETIDWLAAGAAAGDFRTVHAPIPFNYPILNNMAAETSTSEVVLLLNNDTEVQDADWLRGLVGYAMQPDVGAVGPKLLYDDGAIQHAGVVLGVGGVAAHAHCGIDHDAPGALGLAQRTHEVAAVTGACLAMRRSVFDEIGGLDPGLPVAFNDVLLCLAAVDRGYRNLYVHDVWVRHYESKTRGRDDTIAKVKVFNREARYAREAYPALFRDDPWYSPNLSFNLSELYEPAFPPRVVRPWRHYARERQAPRVLILSSALDPATQIGLAATLQARFLAERGNEVVIGAPFRILSNGAFAGPHIPLEEGRDAAAFAVAADVDAIIAHTPNFGDVGRWLGPVPPVLLQYHGEQAEAASGVPDHVFMKEGRLLALPFVETVVAASAAAAGELVRPDAIIQPPGADRLGYWSGTLMPLRDEVRQARGWTGRIVILVASARSLLEDDARDGLAALIAAFDTGAVSLVLFTADPVPAANLPAGMSAVAPATVAERQQIMAAADIYFGPGAACPPLDAIEAAALGLLVVAPPKTITGDTAPAVARALAQAAAAADLPDGWGRRATVAPGWGETLAALESLLARLHGLDPRPAAKFGRLLSPEAYITRSGLFDADFYRASNHDVVGIDPFAHFIANGLWEGRPFSTLFDTHWYVKQYPDAGRGGESPALDYLRAPEGLRDPNPYFSNAAYLAAVAGRDLGGRAPLIHYLDVGAAEGLDIGDAFDGAFYLAAYPDVAASGEPPLAHFLKTGKAEGRQPVPLAATPLDLFDDDAVMRATGRPLADSVPPPAVGSDVVGRSSAARFCIALLRGRADLRARFPDALSAGADGAFARWLQGEGARDCGLSDAGRKHIAALFAADIAARVRQVFLIRPELAADHPLAMTPAGAGGFLDWAIRTGIKAEGLSREAIWWFVLVADEAPARGLVDTFLFTPVWQRLFPDGVTVFGRAAFAEWLKTYFDVSGGWTDPAGWPLPAAPADQIRAAYNARAAWREAQPDALASPATARALLAWLGTAEAALEPEAAAWLANQDRAAIAEVLAAPGLNMLGHFCYASGLRTSTESLVDGFRRNGGQAALRDVWVQERGDENRHIEYADLEVHDITIVHTQPEPLFDDAFPRAGLAPRDPRTYRIGYWYWELETIPEHWQEQADQVDELWTATRFVGDALRKRFDIPVRVIMPGLEHPAFEPLPRRYFDLPENTFLFLFTFHMASIMERKNPLGLIAAFIEAFGDDRSVGLVLKTSFGHMYPEQLAELREAGAGYNVIIIDAVYTQAEVLALMNACDSYISLHRSEGYGLTMAEAMLLGKPVIATGYSGNLDFMTPENSLLVRYDLVTLDRDYPPYAAGMRWAHASTSHAAECMRRVRDDPDWSRELGRRARADLETRMSVVASGGKVVDRIREIAAERRAKGRRPRS